jgi:hypothetical protein
VNIGSLPFDGAEPPHRLEKLCSVSFVPAATW